MRALVTGATALATLAILSVTIAPLSEPDAGGHDRGRRAASIREKRHGGTHGAAGAVKHAAAISAPRRRFSPQEPEIGGAAIVLPPLSGQTAFLDERARKAWSAVADRNADLGLWEVVR